MLRQIVSEVDHADAQRTAAHCAAFGGRDGVILIVEQRVQGTHRQHRQLFQLVEAVDSPEVEGRQGAQRDFAVFVVDIFQRFGRQSNLQAQVRLTHRGDYRIERAVGVAVVDVLDIDAAGRGALLHHQREQLNGFNTLLANAVVLLVLGVQALKLVLIGEEGVIQARDVGRAEQGNIAALQQTGVHQLVDLYPVVHVTNAVGVGTTVVFQHQQAFHFQMPHWVEEGCRAAAHAALRAGFHRGLEMLVERNAAGVEGFAAADRAAQRANAPGVDADAGALGNVFHNRAGGGVDGIQAVAALDQHAGAELTGWGTHAGHDRRRQRDFKGGHRVVETLDIVQTRFARIVREQASGDQNIEELRALINFAGDAVLYQILAFQLFNGCVGEVHVAPVVEETVHLLELFFRVVFQQMMIVFTFLDHLHHVIVERRRLKLTEGFFTQMENRQTRGEVLVIRRVAGDQIRSGFNNGFVDVRGFDTVIELDMGAQLYLGNRNVIQSFCRPIQYAMDFVEIDALGGPVALCHQQTLIHVDFTCP